MNTVTLLLEGCRRERAQTHFYRNLSGLAEEAEDAASAERLNELLADEQHHVSRLTARLLEMGEKPSRVPVVIPAGTLDQWEEAAQAREEAEVAWYEEALSAVDDPQTAAVLSEILESERNHLRVLGGKWMSAAAPTPEAEES